MKHFCLLFIIILYTAFHCPAQDKHTVFLNTGYTYNTDLTLNNEVVQNSRGFLLTVGGTYKLFRYKSFYTEIGLAGKTIFASGKVKEEDFHSRTLRLAVPLKFTYLLSDKWEASSGFGFQNNTDLSKLDLRLRDKYSWRVDFLAEVRHALNDQWLLTAGLSINLRDIPDSYLINDPEDAFYIGVARRIKWLRKKTNGT